jgi:hypothetical protein
MAKVLEFSVGSGGVNKHSDVVKLQEYLNELSPDEGGPIHKLHVTGIYNPETAKALEEFIWFDDWTGPGDDEGPEEDEPFGSASGKRQHSPFNIPHGIDLDELDEIEFVYGKLQFTFSNGSKSFCDNWQ